MKTQTIKELLECYNNDNTKPKLRQKVKNELIRRKKLGLVNIITKTNLVMYLSSNRGVLLNGH